MQTYGMRGLLGAIFLVSVLPSLGCPAERRAASPDPIAAQAAQAEQAMQGTWLLTQAHPDPPLDPVLAALLSAQFGQMRITLNQGLLTAQGVGIQFTRKYQIVGVDPTGRINVVLRDDTGAPMEADGVIQGDTMMFNGRTSPWMGTGELHRVR